MPEGFGLARRLVLVWIVLLLHVSLVSGQLWTANGTDLSVPKGQAWCYSYYASTVHISQADTFAEGSSNNLYAHVSVYASPDLAIESQSTTLGSCLPTRGTNKTCSTSSDNVFTYVSYDPRYILACFECHYWLGPCVFQNYFTTLSQEPKGSWVPCSACN